MPHIDDINWLSILVENAHPLALPVLGRIYNPQDHTFDLSPSVLGAMLNRGQGTCLAYRDAILDSTGDLLTRVDDDTWRLSDGYLDDLDAIDYLHEHALWSTWRAAGAPVDWSYRVPGGAELGPVLLPEGVWWFGAELPFGAVADDVWDFDCLTAQERVVEAGVVLEQHLAVFFAALPTPKVEHHALTQLLVPGLFRSGEAVLDRADVADALGVPEAAVGTHVLMLRDWGVLDIDEQGRLVIFSLSALGALLLDRSLSRQVETVEEDWPS